MKKTSIILYAAIFLAITGSYVLHFTGKKEVTKSQFVNAIPEGALAEGIAYINIDSVILNFQMFQDLRDELLEKQRRADAELNTRGTRFERDVRDFQERVGRGLVTRATAEQMEQSLMQQEQEIINLRDRLYSELMEEDAVMNRQVIDYIMRYLEEQKGVYNYSYVLGRTFGGVVLYSDPAFDISAQVLEGLNNKYQAERRRR